MLCRLQCARCAKRVAHCRRTIRLALGTHTVAAYCGSAPNKCASCTRLVRAATCKRGRMLAHGASLAERRVAPSSNEKVVNQARPERVHVRNRVFIPSSNGREVCSSTHAHSSRYTETYTETGTRWDNRGRGKAGVPIFDGAWGRKCSNEGVACPHLNIFTPSPLSRISERGILWYYSVFERV